MSEVFFCGDHHFGHNNVIKFADKLGNKIRPFDSIEQMRAAILDVLRSE